MDRKNMANPLIILFFLVFAMQPFFATAHAEQGLIKMATTTSTENSGLLDVLIPAFEKDSNIQVKVLPKGTGAAIKDGMDGNVDVILVHAREREDQFINQGYGAYRLAVMHNDFVIIGPKEDPARIRGMHSAPEAFKRIAEAHAKFVSRGDDSGTHIKEQAIWRAIGLELKTNTTKLFKQGKIRTVSFEYPRGLDQTYFSIGQGMGKALTFAEEKQAYALTDRGTYLKYKFGRKQGLDLEILCQGDPMLYNPYGVIPVNPKKYPHANFSGADLFAKWLVSAKAQALIAKYKIEGQQAFFPDAISGSNISSTE